jgi:hypothetical protein
MLSGRPSEVIEPLREWIEDNITISPNVFKFYIGRGYDPRQRVAKHVGNSRVGSWNAYCLYCTTSARNSIIVEGSLIQYFQNHIKCDNDSGHGGGGVADGDEHYVYLVVWYFTGIETISGLGTTRSTSPDYEPPFSDPTWWL